MRGEAEGRVGALSRGIWSVGERVFCMFGEMVHILEWRRKVRPMRGFHRIDSAVSIHNLEKMYHNLLINEIGF
jgi:hypothetical protein